ncbi:hypothetical protein JCM15457_540 [Liquorilactobacillus sucicola DSM 21376 = JCM 15457]|uniref:AraC-type arabinose-binding/dimerisation domain-containing protein n=1 Tax=Liquorilactobacillus sucicola DSM 21376 = JCM 15457 TaxID=1423806 RepID=A0A023CV33_9LACO|nr:hypothetical protein [Liquorilactobacillus sucicola]KRN05578.1 hypothetical protein FD15_GL002141 [Liquorilactobacillus sucicola DSM 21376 = JCM 15457]GAJ25664.1 hypothetical protein JCM15457_540 [Liquorilactobacillus sucicola DSM 21376 = JCM 15457]
MKKYQGNNKIGNIFESDKQIITDLIIPKGKEIRAHHVPYTVVVVPVKGNVVFAGENFREEIKPGIVVRLQPNEKHELKALTDSEIIVVKSCLEQ